MQMYCFEPMSIGSILAQTFRIYRNNFIRFVTIVAIIQVPISLLVAVSNFALQKGVRATRPTEYDLSSYDDPQALYDARIERYRTSTANTDEDQFYSSKKFRYKLRLLIPGILGLFGQILCIGVMTKSVSESYLGNAITVGQAYRFILPKFLTLMQAGICIVLVVHLGLFLLVIAGIIFALWFALTSPAIVVENLEATKGMSRSKALVSGNLGKVFSVCFLFFLLVLIVSILTGYSVSSLGQTIFSNDTILVAIVTRLITVIATILVVPVVATALILLYLDLRIRKEGFDIKTLAKSIGSEGK